MASLDESALTVAVDSAALGIEIEKASSTDAALTVRLTAASGTLSSAATLAIMAAFTVGV